MEMLNAVMRNGVSHKTTPRDINNGLCYYGPASPELVVENGYDKALSSMIESPSFAFRKKSSVPMPEAIDFSVDYTDIGNYLVFATSSNKYAFQKNDIQRNGLAMNLDDLGIDEWRAVTELNNTVEYVLKPTGQSGLYEDEEYIPNYSKSCPSMTNVNVPIKPIYGKNNDINKIGIKISKRANQDEHLRGLIFDDYGYNSETQALLDRLGVGREITGLGVENLEGAHAALYHDNGTSILVESEYIHQAAQAIAQKHGLDGKEAIDEVIRYFLRHELVHNSDHRKFATERKQEIDVGELLAEFYEDRAEIVDEKLARIYRALAEENKDYAESHKISLKSLKSKIQHMARQYASEARAMEMSEEETEAYVADKLEEEIENSEKSELEETIENEETGETRKDEAEAAEENEEYSKEEMSTDEDVQEQGEDTETADESAEEA